MVMKSPKLSNTRAFFTLFWRYRILPHHQSKGRDERTWNQDPMQTHRASLPSDCHLSSPSNRPTAARSNTSLVRLLLKKKGNFFVIRPDIFEVNTITFRIDAERLGFKSKSIVPASEYGNNQRRRTEIVLGHIGGNAALEITIARKHTGQLDLIGDIVHSRQKPDPELPIQLMQPNPHV